jgi:hypothetical protein
MEIEIHPKINTNEKNINKLLKLFNNNLNSLKNDLNSSKNSFYIKKNEYYDLYCEDNIYKIYNNECYLNDKYNLNKQSIDTILDFTIFEKKKKKIECYINYKYNYDFLNKYSLINDTNIYNNSIKLNHIPYDHFYEKRTEYIISLSKKSITKCSIIFNDENKIVDCFIKLELPRHSINYCPSKYIINCIQNNETNMINVYNEDVYSLFLLIGNIL